MAYPSREDFITPSYQGWGIDPSDGSPTIWKTFPSQFDEQGYIDAQYSYMDDYLKNLNSDPIQKAGFNTEAVQQAEAQRVINQANLPQVGLLGGYGGWNMPQGSTPQAGGLSGFSNYGGWGGNQVSGGWGSHPGVGGGLLG
tara:strand:- start:314 stop:736 length:423 start_codon:yes stop_codon:yes gene_type:complete